MKLLGAKPRTEPITAEGSYVKELPRKKVYAERQTEDTGKGHWFEGRVLFISNEEYIEVPARCRATTIYSGASRMVRTAKEGMPKKQRRGRDKAIHTILVEVREHKRK